MVLCAAADHINFEMTVILANLNQIALKFCTLAERTRNAMVAQYVQPTNVKS